MNKKGVAGIELIKPVVFGLLITAILIVVGIVTISEMRNITESSETLIQGNTTTNETVLYVGTRSTYGVKLYAWANRNCKATITACYNATSGVVPIASSNWTVSGCTITSAGQEANVYNDTNWKCIYTFTYNNPYVNDISGNFSYGAVLFFKQSPTFFVLLAIVVLILIIAIIIIAVSRFAGGGEGASMNGGNLSLRTGGAVSDEL